MELSSLEVLSMRVESAGRDVLGYMYIEVVPTGTGASSQVEVQVTRTTSAANNPFIQKTHPDQAWPASSRYGVRSVAVSQKSRPRESIGAVHRRIGLSPDLTCQERPPHEQCRSVGPVLRSAGQPAGVAVRSVELIGTIGKALTSMV